MLDKLEGVQYTLFNKNKTNKKRQEAGPMGSEEHNIEHQYIGGKMMGFLQPSNRE